jgi:hypothetical protein
VIRIEVHTQHGELLWPEQDFEKNAPATRRAGRADGGTELKIGWDGIGVGALADKAGVVEVVEALELAGFESAWLGEHPVVVDPQQPPSPPIA